jgi:large subunit ribosomal protein L10
MSKVVKKLIARDISSKLDGVSDAIVANIVGMTGNENYNIRKTLRDQGISLLVVKRSLAAMATEGTSLRPAFDNQAGSLAILWGCEDFVSLVKSIKKLADSGAFPKFEFKGGVMDGEAMTGEQVQKVAKWPSRLEQISMLVGQILSPGSTLAGQLVGPASTIAGQVKKMIEDREDGDASPTSEGSDASPASEG